MECGVLGKKQIGVVGSHKWPCYMRKCKINERIRNLGVLAQSKLLGTGNSLVSAAQRLGGSYTSPESPIGESFSPLFTIMSTKHQVRRELHPCKASLTSSRKKVLWACWRNICSPRPEPIQPTRSIKGGDRKMDTSGHSVISQFPEEWDD